jgi:glycosyltransferase involved in cell wall biosynthesis
LHRPARILHVGPAPREPCGGIAAYVLGLLASPLAARYRLEVMDTSVPDVFRRVRILRPLLSTWFALRLAAALRQRPDLVHVHTSDYAGFWEKAVLTHLARARGAPVVVHLHGGSFDAFLARLGPHQVAWARGALSAASRVIVLSEAWRPLVERFAPRVVVLPNAIDVAALAPPQPRRPATPPRLLFVGMLSERKGVEDLLAALVELLPLDWTLDVVGGEEFPGARRRIEARSRDLGLESRVRFRGPLYGADKLELLHASDIFVLPSHSESFGIANLEAMAAGLAVVSTRTGAIPEYIADGEHGLLVRPGDVAGLAAALRRVLSDPELRSRLGDAARHRAADYDWSHVAAALAAVYDEVLSEVNVGRR